MTGKKIQVPDLVGFGWNEAREIAEAAGLIPHAVGPDGQPINGRGGVVIDQDLKPRSKVHRGINIALRIAFGGGPARDKDPVDPLPNPHFFDWPDTPAELEKLIKEDSRELAGTSS